MKRKSPLESKRPVRLARSKALLPPLIAAAERGDVEQIAKLIRAGADVNELSNPKQHPYYGADALIVAARHGRVAAAKMLLRNDANIRNRSAYGSAIQQAIDYGHADVVRLLLEHGANDLGYSLFNALIQNRIEIFRVVAGAGISLHSFRERLTKRSLLEEAIKSKKYEIAHFLLDQRVKLHGDELVECAGKGDADLTNRLIEAGADPNRPGRKGRLPLSEASYWGNKAVADVLLQRGADITAKSLRGWTCVDWARYGGQGEMTKWLDSVARERGVRIPRVKVLKDPNF